LRVEVSAIMPARRRFGGEDAASPRHYMSPENGSPDGVTERQRVVVRSPARFGRTMPIGSSGAIRKAIEAVGRSGGAPIDGSVASPAPGVPGSLTTPIAQ
jgi:hypothetical protein